MGFKWSLPESRTSQKVHWSTSTPFGAYNFLAIYHGSGEFTKSPKRPNLEKLDKTVQEYVMSLERHNDHFTIAKFQRRVDKSFENFSKIGAASATEMNIEDIYTG